jgi:hypothetical protein
MKLGIFKAKADLKDKYNKETLLMAEGFLAANDRRYKDGLLSAQSQMKDREDARKKQEKERTENGG